MPFPILGAISVIGSIAYFYLDWRISQEMDESVSQMAYYIELLNGQMTLTEFLTEAWPSLIAVGLILLGGYIIATPRRPKGAVR